jgi:hypothetical protein
LEIHVRPAEVTVLWDPGEEEDLPAAIEVTVGSESARLVVAYRPPAPAPKEDTA